MTRRDVLREMCRANRHDGYSTSIPGRIAVLVVLCGLCWLTSSSTTDAALFTLFMSALTAAGLKLDYDQAQLRLQRRRDVERWGR